MSPAHFPPLRRFMRDEDGSTIVEFAVVTCIFLFLFFGLIDLARLGYTTVMAEKATERAVRMAVVHPPACSGVKDVNGRSVLGALASDAPNGTLCASRNGLCVDPGPVSCTGSAENPTSAAIWAQIAGLLPAHATPENLMFTYDFDAELNRVGAPYAPIVTVALHNLDLEFISPLGALASAAGASGAEGLGGSYVFQSMSASLPSETIR
ncbi:MAG: TadE/TadG family type IV pilus assembly protein [Sulfitobacter sp.]